MTSFENLLMLIANEDLDIDVYAIVDEGDARDRISRFSRILNDKRDGSKQEEKAFSFRKIAKSAKDLLSSIGFDLGSFLIKRLARRFDCSKYDVVIGYQEGYATEFVAYSNAKRKIAWVHSMYSRWGNVKTTNIYDKLDTIVCVSETAKKDMIAAYPKGKGRIEVVYNSLNKENVVSLSREYVSSQKADAFRIISVGRIDPVKRFSYIPVIADELKKRGLNFIWTIIGGVAVKEEYEKLINSISQLELKNEIVLKGQLDNPYPEIKNSDLLVCLSSSETFNYTLMEARFLGVPVIATNFTAAKEFVNNSIDGIISPLDEMADVIEELISDDDKYNEFKSGLKNYTYDNNRVLESFRQLLLVP